MIGSFKKVTDKLLPFLQLKILSGLDQIFTQELYDYAGSDQAWIDLLTRISNDYGMVEKVISIDPISSNSAKIILKTSSGTLTYKIHLALPEKDKISGLLVIDFSKK